MNTVIFTKSVNDPDKICEPIDLPEGHAIIIADKPDFLVVPKELVETLNFPERVNVKCLLTLVFQDKFATHYITDYLYEQMVVCVAKLDKFYWHLRTISQILMYEKWEKMEPRNADEIKGESNESKRED